MFQVSVWCEVRFKDFLTVERSLQATACIPASQTIGWKSTATDGGSPEKRKGALHQSKLNLKVYLLSYELISWLRKHASVSNFKPRAIGNPPLFVCLWITQLFGGYRCLHNWTCSWGIFSLCDNYRPVAKKNFSAESSLADVFTVNLAFAFSMRRSLSDTLTFFRILLLFNAMGCIQSIRCKPRSFRESIIVLEVNSSIDSNPTTIDESSNVVLRYRTPHFRASARVLVPPVCGKETWTVGWIQACNHMEFYNKYGNKGM